MTGQVTGGMSNISGEFHLVQPAEKPKGFQFGKRVTLKRGSQDSVVLPGKVVEGGKKLSSTDQKKYALMVLKDGNMGKVTKVAIHIDDAAKSLYGSDREIKNNPTLQKEKASFKKLAHELSAAENHVQETLKAREKIQAQFEGSAFDEQLKELDEQGFDDREISTLLQGTDAEAATVLKTIGEAKLERAKELREQGKELRASFKEYEAALNQYEDASQMLQNIIGNAAQVRIFATQTFTSHSSVEAEVSKLMRKVADFTGDSVQGKKDELKRLSEEAEDPEVRAAAEKLLASMDWLNKKIEDLKSKLNPKLENWPQHRESAITQLNQLRRFADDGVRDIQSREIELAKAQATPELVGTALKQGLELIGEVTEEQNEALKHLNPEETPTEKNMNKVGEALTTLAGKAGNNEVKTMLQGAKGLDPNKKRALYLAAFAALTGTYVLMRYSGVSFSDIFSDPKGSFTIFTTAAGQALGGAYNWAFGSQKMPENLIDFANRTPTTLVKASQEGIAQAGQRLADFINQTPVASVMDNLAEFPKAAAKKTLDLATQSPNPILGNMAEIPENAASIGLGIGLLNSLRDQGASAFNKLGSYLPELKMPDVRGTISSLKSRVFGGKASAAEEGTDEGIDVGKASAAEEGTDEGIDVSKEEDMEPLPKEPGAAKADFKGKERKISPQEKPFVEIQKQAKAHDTALRNAKKNQPPYNYPTPAPGSQYTMKPTTKPNTQKGPTPGAAPTPTASRPTLAPRPPTAQQVSKRGFVGKNYTGDEHRLQSRPEDAPKGPGVTTPSPEEVEFEHPEVQLPSFSELNSTLLNRQFVNPGTLTSFMESGDFVVDMTPEELLKMAKTVSGALKQDEGIGSDLVEEGQTVHIEQLLAKVVSSGKEGANALLKSAQSLSKEDIVSAIERAKTLGIEGANALLKSAQSISKEDVVSAIERAKTPSGAVAMAVGAASMIALVQILNHRRNPLFRELKRLQSNTFAVGAKERKEHIARLKGLETSQDPNVSAAAKKFRDYSETYFVRIDAYNNAIRKGILNPKHHLPDAQKALTNWQRMEQKPLWNEYGYELREALNAAGLPIDPKLKLADTPQKKAASPAEEKKAPNAKSKKLKKKEEKHVAKVVDLGAAPAGKLKQYQDKLKEYKTAQKQLDGFVPKTDTPQKAKKSKNAHKVLKENVERLKKEVIALAEELGIKPEIE